MTDEELMRLAIKEAEKSQEKIPCGVVIAKDGVVIEKAFNKQHTLHNATSHAEIIAIGEAGKVVGDKNLNGCDIYCTCEPCTMCLSAIVFAKIERLVYGVSLADVSPTDKRIDISIEEFLDKSPNKPEVTNNFMLKECKKLYKGNTNL